MAKKPLPAVAADFEGAWSFFRDRGIVPAKPGGAMVDAAKRMHRATYSLILWRFRLKNLPEHGRVFIEEIASDALQILPQSLMGYGKTAGLLIRGVIENTLRHLYFSDHPVEFERMNREQKWYLAQEELVKYAIAHPAILQTEPRFDAVRKIGQLYSELSAGVHGRRVQDLEMRAALNRIVFELDSFKRQVKFTETCAEAANFLLATFHRDRVENFQLEDRQIILLTMRPGARKVWSGLS